VFNLENGVDGWRYADFDREGKPNRSSYTPKVGDITYKMYIESLEEG
jgi:hypothetical protein